MKSLPSISRIALIAGSMALVSLIPTAVEAAAKGGKVVVANRASGNISVSGSNDGHANLTVPVSGPSGSGSIRVVATKANGIWTYSELRLNLGNGEFIDLLEPESQPVVPAPLEGASSASDENL